MSMHLPAYFETPGAVKTPGFAEAALRHAAELWFFVAVLGQCAILYRVVAQYGIATVSGHFEDWKRNNEL